MLAILGGIAFAGVTYGPDLVERATGADGNNGPTAPLEYPMPTATPTAVRTATFTVSELDRFGGTLTYEVPPTSSRASPASSSPAPTFPISRS